MLFRSLVKEAAASLQKRAYKGKAIGGALGIAGGLGASHLMGNKEMLKHLLMAGGGGAVGTAVGHQFDKKPDNKKHYDEMASLIGTPTQPPMGFPDIDPASEQIDPPSDVDLMPGVPKSQQASPQEIQQLMRLTGQG